jgi:hypothetical protein
MNEHQELHDEGKRLILAAFAEARDKGVPDWRRMTSAVLKNRLLALTNRRFTERRWNATSFRHFLAQYPDVLVIDASRHPPVVELRDQELEGPPTAAAAGEPERLITAKHRIRSDLWQAVLDYSSGRGYVWDEDTAAAVAVAAPDEDRRPTLPTVNEPAYASWRDEFAREHTPVVSTRLAEAIERWKSEGLPTTQLPAAVRGQWNAALKRHVLETLEAWFEAHQIEIPDDLVEEVEPTRPPPASTEGLRDLVLACVAVMTREELEALSLPPAAVLRTRRQPPRRGNP